MKVFDTLSGQKKEFIPVDKTVTMYVCGVTVYDECHIGHAMSYVIFDAIRRYLEEISKTRRLASFSFSASISTMGIGSIDQPSEIIFLRVKILW